MVHRACCEHVSFLLQGAGRFEARETGSDCSQRRPKPLGKPGCGLSVLRQVVQVVLRGSGTALRTPCFSQEFCQAF